MSGTEIESRYAKTTAGWFTRKGTQAGLPMLHPDRLRTVGVDKNLQERFDEMYKDEREAFKRRRNIGFSKAEVAAGSGNENRRIRMLEYRKKQRQDKELERAARLNLLEVDVAEVKREQVACGALFDEIVAAADLYGVFEDLYGPDLMFRPCVDLEVAFDLDDGEHVLPVHRGNVVKPFEAKSAPEVSFQAPPAVAKKEGEEGDENLWTLVLSNPDGHFYEDEAEYLHWMVSNIPGGGEGGVGDLSQGDTVVPYLQPFPPHGTGFHRMVFVLYKQSSRVDLSKYRQPPVEDGVDLAARTFRSREFFESNNKSSEEGTAKTGLTPAGLAFFQTDYDTSLHKFYHNVLDMKEPKYEYNFAEPYVEPWDDMYDNQGTFSFNMHLDRFRDPKDQQEEILKKRLKAIHPFKGDLDKEIRYPNVHYPRAYQMKYNWQVPSWRIREIERERLRRGVYKDLDHADPRRDPSNA